MKMSLAFDYTGRYFLYRNAEGNGASVDISEDLMARFDKAEAQWEAVQRELSEIEDGILKQRKKAV